MVTDENSLIFLHIPKTAGSTFHTILNKKYRDRDVQNVFGARYKAPAIADFIAMPMEKKTHIKMLKGHMPFGLHEYMPGASTYIAFLRDPVDRVISLYYYILKNKHNPMHEAVAVNGMSLDEFVSSGVAIGANNGHCRFINGDLEDYDFDKCDETLYENVIRHIDEHFLWLGITERFDESMLVLTHLLGWKKPPCYFRGNTSKVRKKTSQIDASTLQLIEQYNTLDRRLYEYANQRLDQQISRIPDFADKLAAYQRKNEKLQTRWGWLPDSLRQLLV